MTRLGQIEAAALALEQGRARGLAETLALDSADSSRIRDTEQRAKYEKVLQVFIAAQKEIHTAFPPHWTESERRQINLERTARYHKAQDGFNSIIIGIRASQDLGDFLDDRVDKEWFSQMDHEPPAVALARAQYWLRTATRQDLQEWYTTNPVLGFIH